MRSIVLICSIALVTGVMSGQELNTGEAVAKANTYLRQHAEKWGLDASDIGEMRLSSSYTSDHNGVTHVYMVQQYQGADIESATFNVNIQNGEVLSAYQKLIPTFGEKVRHSSLSVSAQNALNAAMHQFSLESRGPVDITDQPGPNRFVFDKTGYSHSSIYVELVYLKSEDDLYDLTWKVSIEPVSNHNLYSVYVDAGTGKVIKTRNLSISCHFEHAHTSGCRGEIPVRPVDEVAEMGDGAQYLVIPIPFESPNHIERRLVVDPSDDAASPYGWHDTNGSPGAEATTTFGNNVHAFADRDGDFDDNEVIVDGGVDLEFIFPFPENEAPEMYQAASVTNLFYMNNIMHDFAWHYGFNEAAGNFQEFNYTGEGVGSDNIRAHAQFGAGTSNPPLNNALFSSPRDGSNGRMRMYIWEGNNRLLRVDEPAIVAGGYNTGTTVDDWGAEITAEPVTGEVAIADDGSGTPTLGCFPFVNGQDINGKIALIDRGECDFGCKALYAQDAGAIGFIICNVQEGLVNMLPGECGSEVTIPGVFLSNSDCQTIRAFVDNGLIVSLVNENDTMGTLERAGSFDNTVIAHEYGHGISGRLVGGPDQSDCLVNYDTDFDGNDDEGEQMGEGWSDFFSLVTTVKATDIATRNRSVATYSKFQDTTGLGLRDYPYTVDMSVNPLTYDDVAFSSVPHGVGTVWCSMLWDLYWALTDKYGFDPDLYKGTGGNNLAIQLVMDGMKMQACRPSFIEARDAILDADLALTGGENELLIWEVFARRGLGRSADAGEEYSRSDGEEAFDVPADLIPTVKLYKEMTPWIDAGDAIDVTLTVHNHKSEAASSVIISDAIPEGTFVVPASGSIPFAQQGDLVIFEPGTIQPSDSMVITYKLSSSPNIVSERLFFDDIEEGVLNWAVTSETGSETWRLEQNDVYSGSNAWRIMSLEESADASLFNIESILITGDQPLLVFKHKVSTQRFRDAGAIFISSDDGTTWNPLSDGRIIRNKYTGKVAFSTFGLFDSKAWHGESEGWEVVLADLSEFIGQEVRIRFRFASDDNVASEGWFLDDIEVLDAEYYNSEACLTSAELDEVCASGYEGGTYVNFGIVSSDEDIAKADESIQVYPNPATSRLYVKMNADHAADALVELVDVTGKRLHSQSVSIAESMVLELDVNNYASGIYFVRAVIDGRIHVSKLILN